MIDIASPTALPELKRMKSTSDHPTASTLDEEFARLLPWVRSQFPQIGAGRSGEPRIYLDSGAGTLMPDGVAAAMHDAALWSNPQPGRDWPASQAAKASQDEARSALRSLVNAPSDDPFYLSESSTASLYKLREALDPELTVDGAVVVTDCDHFSNISAWEWRARAEVRRAAMTPDGDIDLESLHDLLDERVRVVAMPVAGNGLGTIMRTAAASALVRDRSPAAVIVLDAVHAAPHLPIDLSELDCDALVFSTYKLFGPGGSVLRLRADLAARLSPFHVEPHAGGGGSMEWGTVDNCRVAGILASLDYLRRLGSRMEARLVGQWSELSRDCRLYRIALTAIQAYEASMSREVLAFWKEHRPGVLYGVTDPDETDRRVPTFAFRLEGRDPSELDGLFWEKARIQLASGNHYSGAVTRGLGLEGVGRASFAHYNDHYELKTFLLAAQELARP